MPTLRRTTYPKKKEIIKQKRNQAKQMEQEKQDQTYARVAEKNNRKNKTTNKKNRLCTNSLGPNRTNISNHDNGYSYP